MRINIKGVAAVEMTQEQHDKIVKCWHEIGGTSQLFHSPVTETNNGDTILTVPGHPKGAEHAAVAWFRIIK